MQPLSPPKEKGELLKEKRINCYWKCEWLEVAQYLQTHWII